MEKQRAQYKAAVEALADPLQTRLVLVARAQQATLREVARAHEELAAIGLKQQHLVINGILPSVEADNDPLAAAIYEREQAALHNILATLTASPRDNVQLKPLNLVGLDAMPQDTVGRREGGFDFFFGSRGMSGIINAPVRPYHRPEIRRAGFPGGVGAHGDDHIRNQREVFPGLAVQAVHGDVFTFQKRESTRVDLLSRLTSALMAFQPFWAKWLKVASAKMERQELPVHRKRIFTLSLSLEWMSVAARVPGRISSQHAFQRIEQGCPNSILR